MTLARTLTAFSLAVATLLTVNQAAKADSPQDIFRKIRQVQVQIGGGSPKHSPGHGHVQPPSYGYPVQPCPPTICPPCPPAPRCVYCVYYLDCHGHWKFYGRYDSRWSASSAQQQLQRQGYRTYVQVKHIGGGYPGYPGGFPADTPFASR